MKKFNFKASHKASFRGLRSRKKQRGATLIVVLVILISMTFLGLGSMSDTNLQLAMVRNSQMHTNAYTIALAEIDAQLDEINSNGESDQDTMIFNLVQENPDSSGFRSVSPDKLVFDLLDVSGDGSSLTDAAIAYDTTLALVEPDANYNPPIENYTISPDSTVRWMVMELQSNAAVKNTNSESNQIQGFRYLSAN